MTPILFSKTETTFTSNGIGRLTDCISCTVTEERNGIYECELEYPITGKWYNEMTANGGIIGVIHDDNHDIQPFDLYMSTAPIDGVVTFYAHHISYRLNNIILQPFTASTASAAIAAISNKSVNTNPFTFSTDKTVTAQFVLSKPQNVRSVLFGEEGSFLDTFGTAEFKFDKFNVQMLLHRGTDTGVTVRYGKNMTDIERTVDDSETFNAIAPYWSDGVNYVYPDSIIVYPTTQITPVKPIAMDFSDKFEQQPTKAELTTAAKNYLDTNQPWLVSDNITIDFIAMWQTPEYESVAAIQRVGLCDTVSVYYTDMGIVAEKKEVVRVVFDVLAERFSEMELGSVSNAYVAIDTGTGQSASVSIDSALNGKVAKTGDTMSGNLKIVKEKNTDSLILQTSDDSASTTPAANQNGGAISFIDDNGSLYGAIKVRHLTNGMYGLWLYAQGSSNSVLNTLQIRVDSNDNKNVYVSDPNAWLAAFGLGTSGALPITVAQGGTGAITASAALSNLGGLPYVTLSNMTANTTAALTTALNADITAVPTGVSVVRCGNSSNTNRCALLVIRSSATVGKAISISAYTALHNISLTLGSSGWGVG